MKMLLRLALASLLGFVFATPARAQVFGQFTPSEPVPVNGHLFGAYLTASENFFGVMSQLRLSFYPNMDFGFQGGLSRIDFEGTDATILRIGGDFKYLTVRSSDGSPVDLAVGAALGVETGDDISLLTVGPSIVASRHLPIGSGGFTPYLGLAMLFSNLDILNNESTDISLPFRAGTEFRLSQEIRLQAEFQFRVKDDFNDDVSFVTGVNLPF